MNITLLHTICETEKNKRLEWFKHEIDNALFPLDEAYISQNCKHMTVDIGTSVTKQFIETYYTISQLKVMDQIIKSYKIDATKEGRLYAKSCIH